MTRRPLIAGNWKMHKTAAEARAAVDTLVGRLPSSPGPEIAVCGQFTALPAMAESARGSSLLVFAQNMHEAPAGAFTGEVSAGMLGDLGVDGVLLGHSERRQYFGETDRALAAKLPAALDAGLRPLLCVGETEDERQAGGMQRKLRHQVNEALERVAPERLSDVVVAYEPIWAIGTGSVATPDQAQEAIAFVRALVNDRSPAAAEQIRILYGGSVNGDNAAELLGLPDVDGALVGGASLQPDSLWAIVEAAAA